MSFGPGQSENREESPGGKILRGSVLENGSSLVKIPIHGSPEALG
jgi:hypothetical protein